MGLLWAAPIPEPAFLRAKYGDSDDDSHDDADSHWEEYDNVDNIGMVMMMGIMTRLIMVLCPGRLFETNNPPHDRQDWDV